MPTSTKSQPQLEKAKLVEMLELDPEKFDFDFQFKYRNQKFHFYLLIKNKVDESQEAIYLGSQ